MSKLKVGDKVRIDSAGALLTYAQSYQNFTFENREMDLEHIRKLIDFDGFEAEVVNVSGARETYPNLLPLSERPDGHGMAGFSWSARDLVKIED